MLILRIKIINKISTKMEQEEKYKFINFLVEKKLSQEENSYIALCLFVTIINKYK